MSKVMIVDDDATMVSLLTTLLEMDGFEVASIDGQYDIIAQVRQANPDLLLMDVFLTGEDGIELLRQIRAHSEMQSLRVVMVSGMNLADKSADAGADAFLLKPYTPDQLIETIQKHLGDEGN